MAEPARRRPALRRPLPDEVVELVAARLRVFAEPTRNRLLALLDEGDATVQELADQMMTTHQNVSTHWPVSELTPQIAG